MINVYFTKDLSAADQLFEAAGFSTLLNPPEPVALKTHFGEEGNTAYLKPAYVKPIADKIFSLGGKPFFIDANTLYGGSRGSAEQHYQTALRHGFDFIPVIIADEKGETTVPVNLKHFKEVYLGKACENFKIMLVLTHFKGHELTGFGGTLKNLGMGLASRRGKLFQHSDCENCKAQKGCKKFETLSACWVGGPTLAQEKIVEYAYGAVKDKKVGYINFICNVSEQCDCYAFNSEPIVPDIGILASFDPVAIDQASVDLVNQTAGRISGADKFRALYPEVDWEIQLRYAEEIGLGKREYNLMQCATKAC